MRPVFLDRDGVINRESSDLGSDYIRDIKQFEILPGTAEALKLLSDNSYDIYIVSNQAGVSKGLYKKELLEDINSIMEDEFEKYRVKIKDIRYCIHQDSDNCSCRKPKTGLFEGVIESYNGLKREEVFYIGDTKRDIESAKNFNISSILVLSGKIKIDKVLGFGLGADFIARDLYDAVKNIILR
jgi:D-glycero-D-manno-heptose 1,7-bisphosphate phosphatase